MSKKVAAKTIRRSFVLPSNLVEEACTVSNKNEATNLNKLVTIALQEYVNNKKRKEFENSMLAMGNDPEILRECAAINKDFLGTEMDGLRKGK